MILAKFMIEFGFIKKSIYYSFIYKKTWVLTNLYIYVCVLDLVY